jgi:hypothetical protein
MGPTGRDVLRAAVEIPERTIRRGLVVVLDFATKGGVQGALLDKDVREEVVHGRDLASLARSVVCVAVGNTNKANMAPSGHGNLIKQVKGVGLGGDEVIVVRREAVPACAVVVDWVCFFRFGLVFLIRLALFVGIIFVIHHQRPRGRCPLARCIDYVLLLGRKYMVLVVVFGIGDILDTRVAAVVRKVDG